MANDNPFYFDDEVEGVSIHPRTGQVIKAQIPQYIVDWMDDEQFMKVADQGRVHLGDSRNIKRLRRILRQRDFEEDRRQNPSSMKRYNN